MQFLHACFGDEKGEIFIDLDSWDGVRKLDALNRRPLTGLQLKSNDRVVLQFFDLGGWWQAPPGRGKVKREGWNLKGINIPVKLPKGRPVGRLGLCTIRNFCIPVLEVRWVGSSLIQMDGAVLESWVLLMDVLQWALGKKQAIGWYRNFSSWSARGEHHQNRLKSDGKNGVQRKYTNLPNIQREKG